jgi:hypothetical protein
VFEVLNIYYLALKHSCYKPRQMLHVSHLIAVYNNFNMREVKCKETEILFIYWVFINFEYKSSQ